MSQYQSHSVEDVCTCDKSAICFIHKPSGAALGSDKIQPSVFVIVDAEFVGDSYEEHFCIEIESIHKSFDSAYHKIMELIKENSEVFERHYDQTDSDAKYVTMFEDADGDFIAIQEMTLED